MASRLVETVERDGETINIYESGAEYSVTRGRLIRPATNNLISAENSNEYKRRRQELKRERLMAGAIERLTNGRTDRMPDDLDVIQALGNAAMQRATDTNTKNNKQIDAIRLILHETGLSEDDQPAATHNTINMFVLPEGVARLFQEMKKRLPSERDISESNNLRIDAAAGDAE